MKYFALISGIIVIFAVSLMLSGCSQKGQNFTNENQPQTEQVTQNSNSDKGTEIKLIALPATPDYKSAGVKENVKVNKKKEEVKIQDTKEEKKEEVKTETKTKDPRLADDSAMDPKNKFPDDYNGK